MTAVQTVGRFTRADLDAMPDDGRRYELLDGTIVVSPSPGGPHQIVVSRLLVVLHEAAPAPLRALVGPYDVELPSGDVLVPDLLVASAEAIGDHLAGLPLLAVEVLSPSSGRRDLGDKLTAYRDAGVPSYWVVTRPSRDCGPGRCATERTSRSPTSAARRPGPPSRRTPSRCAPATWCADARRVVTGPGRPAGPAG